MFGTKNYFLAVLTLVVLSSFSLVAINGSSASFLTVDGIDDKEEVEVESVDDEDEVLEEDTDESKDEEDMDKDEVSDVEEKIASVKELLERAQTVIAEKEAEGKDVSFALERLAKAQALLDDAVAALDAGDLRLAANLAREAKHMAMYAKGKDIRSETKPAKFGRDFGKCVSSAAKDKSEEFQAELDECFAEFKEKVGQHVEDKLSKEDKLRNKELKRKLRRLAKSVDSEEEGELLLDFADFTFSGVEESEVVGQLEGVLRSNVANKKELLRERIAELKKAAREHKFEMGVIPFKDTDDQDWYFSFVDQMKSENCVSGYKDAEGNSLGEFRPGNEVRFGESVKLVVECLLNEVPADVAAGKHWAQRHAEVLKEEFGDLLSEDLVEEVDSALVNEDRYAREFTRAELVQLIVDVLNLEGTEVTVKPFDDVDIHHVNAKAIALAKEMGLITGDAEAGTFRPDDVPNRAEVAKMLMLAKELL